MLKIAFASADREHVDLHFGAAERFVLYAVEPGLADLIGVGEFVRVQMKGENKERSLPRGERIVPDESMAATPEELAKPPEDKVLAKLDFLQGCAAVYAASIGTSSIKRLMAIGVQPIIVDNGHEIVDLLNEVSFAMAQGGLAWVDKAMAREKPADRFEMMAKEGWLGSTEVETGSVTHKLITSIDDLD